MTFLLCVLLVFVIGAPVAAQTSSNNDEDGTSRQLSDTGVPFTRALRVDQDPVVDGDVLSDPAWVDALPVSAFTQNTPDEGNPASEHTDVFIVYTEDTLYFGVVCYVENPATIIVAERRRLYYLVLPQAPLFHNPTS